MSEPSAIKKRYKVIACEILFREVSLCAALSRNIIDPVFLRKGLHDMGEAKMKARLQQEIDAVDHERYDAVLLVYGLCNNGVRGLSSKLPLVIPRAHDCITLLMGSKEKYMRYFEENSGTYFKSSGWIEREADTSADDQSITSQLGYNRTYEEFVAQYGEENAAYLTEMLGDWLNQYKRLAFIDTGTGDRAADIKATQELAAERAWEFEEIKGDIRLITNLLNGQWDEEEFLIIPPTHQLMPSFDESVVTAVSKANI